MMCVYIHNPSNVLCKYMFTFKCYIETLKQSLAEENKIFILEAVM